MTTPVQVERFFEALDKGHTIKDSCGHAKFSFSTGRRLIAKRNYASDHPEEFIRGITPLPAKKATQRDTSKDGLNAKRIAGQRGPVPLDRLNERARRGLEDFDFFRLTYFGRVATPWQRMAAEELVALLATSDKEYVVVNCPPTAGKTTLLHDIVCWMICRDRSVRILMGSATMQQAKKALNRVRRSLERSSPEMADAKWKERGLAVDAVTTLAADYGRLKPLEREQWTNEAFIVMQHDEIGSISEKESTVQAYGMDANYLGDRVDFALWDDLVDPKTTRSVELREQLEERWGDIAESRLEPGGLMALVGQRIAGDDLYRYCLDLLQPLDAEDEDILDEMTPEELENVRRDKKYKHIKFKAHYGELCAPHSHKLSAEPYPKGCLLDPRRITYREISSLMSNRSNRFQVLYQQEDIGSDEAFVQNDWIYGYGGHPGCIDKDRDRWEMPAGILASECTVVATADPSPTNYWGVICWVYAPKYNQRFVLDIYNGKMEAPDFLDYNIAEGRFTGLMEDWQRASEMIGFPIQFWVVEKNAAQRYLLQYDLVKKWIAQRGVEVRPHSTQGFNKNDEQLGVQTIREHYKFGRVRLMGRGEGKVLSQRLINEVTKYGHARTDDLVMSHWFFEWNLDKLKPRSSVRRPAWRPSFVKSQSMRVP